MLQLYVTFHLQTVHLHYLLPPYVSDRIYPHQIHKEGEDSVDELSGDEMLHITVTLGVFQNMLLTSALKSNEEKNVNTDSFRVDEDLK